MVHIHMAGVSLGVGPSLLDDSQDKNCSVNSRAAFMAITVMYPVAIIQGQLRTIKTVAINHCIYVGGYVTLCVMLYDSLLAVSLPSF